MVARSLVCLLKLKSKCSAWAWLWSSWQEWLLSLGKSYDVQPCKMFGLSFQCICVAMPVNARICFPAAATAGNHRGRDRVPPGCQLLGKVYTATSHMSSKCWWDVTASITWSFQNWDVKKEGQCWRVDCLPLFLRLQTTRTHYTDKEILSDNVAHWQNLKPQLP